MLAAVTWKDAWSDKGQVSIDALSHSPVIVTTYGQVLRSDEEGLSIASETLSDGTFRDVTFIPAKMITSVKLLSIRSPRAKRPTPAAQPPPPSATREE